MKRAVLALAIAWGLALAGAAAQAGARVILVGDSTMATRSGYGDALCARIAPAECINLARGGRSSLSFRAEGLWTACSNCCTMAARKTPGC